MGAAREQARLLGKPPADVTIAIPGGAGLIGRQLVEELAKEFAAVVALDPRYADERRWEGNILYTDLAQDVGRADAVLVLTARGDQASSIVPFLTPGAVVADDTYPEVPLSLREEMEAAGATVLKAAVTDRRFRTLPRIPIFRDDEIPGCLLEAMVVADQGAEVLASQDGVQRRRGKAWPPHAALAARP